MLALSMRFESWVRTRVAVALVAAVLGGGGVASAQSDQEIAAARQWFKEADAAEKKKDYEGALGLFKKAAQVKETPQLLLRIGGCQDKLGDFAGALRSYERAQEKAGLAGADKAKVEEAANEVIEGVRGKVAILTIASKESYKDLSVKLDGAPAAAGDKVPLNPGGHKVTAEATGRRPFEESFTVMARDTKTVTIELAAEPGAAGAPAGAGAAGAGPPSGGLDRPVTSGSAGPGVLPIVLLAGGGAAVAGGVVLFVVSLVKDGKIDDLCHGDRNTCPKSRQSEIESDVSTVNTFQVVAGIVGGAGLVAAGVGAALLIAAPPPKTGRVQILPSASKSSVGLAARGQF